MKKVSTILLCVCACCAASAATREWKNGSGGTLSGVTLAAALDDVWANTNEIVTLDCALSGVTKVDFGIAPGASAPKPLPRGLEVANFTGASIGAWKGVNLGDPTLTTAFRLEGGKVLCDFRRSGMVIVVK